MHRGSTRHDGTSRAVALVITLDPVIEGAAVRLRRSIGSPRLDHLDPFLPLHHCESANLADEDARACAYFDGSHPRTANPGCAVKTGYG